MPDGVINLDDAPLPRDERPSGGRVITFYSYKGGTGRTMSLANVAWLLALNNQRVLVVDWDLEAPGLHRFFHPFLDDAELNKTDGLLDLVVDLASMAAAQLEMVEQHELDVFDYIQMLHWPSDSGSGLTWRDFGERSRIDLLTAGRQGANYARKLAGFDWIRFYEKLHGRRLLRMAKRQMQEVYDYILIDSRTGVSDTSGICTIELPDTLVICFTLNNQSILGASAIADSARLVRAHVKEDGGSTPLRIFPVPSRVEVTSEHDRRMAVLNRALTIFSSHLDHIEDPTKYWALVRIAYWPIYAFEEVPAVFVDKDDGSYSLLNTVGHLTSALTDGTIQGLPQTATSALTDARREEAKNWYLQYDSGQRNLTKSTAFTDPATLERALELLEARKERDYLESFRIAAETRDPSRVKQPPELASLQDLVLTDDLPAVQEGQR